MSMTVIDLCSVSLEVHLLPFRGESSVALKLHYID